MSEIDPLFYETNQYNPLFFRGYEEQQEDRQQAETVDGINIDDINLQDYLKADGSIISTEVQTMPGINLYSNSGIRFPNNSVQLQAFTDQNSATLDTHSYKLQAITYDEDNNIILVPAVEVSKVMFSDGEQSKAYTNEKDTTNLLNEYKLTNQTYNQSQNKTTFMGTLHSTNFTTDTFNASHLVNTTSAIQPQISDNRSNIVYLDERCDTLSDNITQEHDKNEIQDISLNTLTDSYNLHIQNYTTTTSNLINATDELYDLNQAEKVRNDFQDISLNTLTTSYNDYVIQTDDHLQNIDSSLNSLQTQNIINIENDILALQNKTENIETTTNGMRLTHIFECRNIILNSISSQINFGDGSLQGTAFTNSLKTKLTQMPTINNIAKLGCSYIGYGTVTNDQFSTLENISSNIQQQINDIYTTIGQLNSSSTVTNFETNSTNELLNTALSVGNWFGETNTTWNASTSFPLQSNTLYHFNLQFDVDNLTELKVMRCRISVRDALNNLLYDQSKYQGVYLDEQTSKEPIYAINNQLYYKNTTLKNVKIQVDTIYHFKPGFNCTFGARLQVARIN